jgi:hypothetical protein
MLSHSEQELSCRYSKIGAPSSSVLPIVPRPKCARECWNCAISFPGNTRMPYGLQEADIADLSLIDEVAQSGVLPS